MINLWLTGSINNSVLNNESQIISNRFVKMPHPESMAVQKK